MGDYIKKIRTNDGDKQIDYKALANLPATFDYYIEKNQDEDFNYNGLTTVGTYLLCTKTEEDYIYPPWQQYKLLTVVDGDPDYTIQTEYDLSYGGCRRRDNYHEGEEGGEWKDWEDVFVDKSKFDDAMGDIETSLDTIIAMQNSLIAPTQVTPAQETGGDTE